MLLQSPVKFPTPGSPFILTPGATAVDGDRPTNVCSPLFACSRSHACGISAMCLSSPRAKHVAAVLSPKEIEAQLAGLEPPAPPMLEARSDRSEPPAPQKIEELSEHIKGLNLSES
jgi:hypothetical protein